MDSAGDHAVGVLGGILWAAVGVVVLLLAIGGILWATDYGLEATVVDKECAGSVFSGSASSVTVRTKLFGIDHTVEDFPNAQCHGLRAGDEGNFVRYHIRSGQTILYEREGGACIWDSERGVGC